MIEIGVRRVQVQEKSLSRCICTTTFCMCFPMCANALPRAARTRFPRDKNRSGGAPGHTDRHTHRQRIVSGRPGRRRPGSGRRGRPAEHCSPLGRQSWKKYPVQGAAAAIPPSLQYSGRSNKRSIRTQAGARRMRRWPCGD